MTLLEPTARPGRLQIRPPGLVLAAILVSGLTYGASWLSSRPASSSQAVAAPAMSQGGSLDSDGSLGGSPGEATAPADLATIDTQIEVWAAKSAADPHDDISAGNLALLYLGRGRLTGDAADYERALAAADRAVAAYPTSSGARALKATVLQATHDFSGALALAEQVLAEQPGNVEALAIAGDVRLELGRLDEARSTYAAIAAIAPGPALDVRLARLAWLSGDAARALELATRAQNLALDDDNSDLVYYESQLGELLRMTGHTDQARQGFEAALAIRPMDQLALLGVARLDAFAGHDAAAIAGLRRAAAIAPRPETLALLADLLARGGDTKGAAEQAATLRVIEQIDGAAATLFDRQILGFELDHGSATQAILERAETAAQIRPDAGGLDAVAWAAYRLGDLAMAGEFSARARSTGSVDARILYHAGAIAVASGQLADGRALLRQSLDLGPALDPLDRAAAEALLAGG